MEPLSCLTPTNHSHFGIQNLHTPKPTNLSLSLPLSSALFTISMARLSALAFVFIVVFASVVSTLEARKLFDTSEHQFKKRAASYSLDGSLFLSALPKGTVPASTPSKKGHAFIVDEKLIARRHLVGNDRRALQSVPSPGVGH